MGGLKIKKNYINKLKQHKGKLGIIALTTPFYTIPSAASSGTSEAVTAALNTVAQDVQAVLAAVAPVGLAIGGTFLAWRLGMRFFKALAK